MFKFLSAALVALFFVGCASTSYQTTVPDAPLAEIQKAITDNLPQGLGFVSQNRREFYSKVFFSSDSKSKAALVMRVVVYGDRRPYSLGLSVRQVYSETGNVMDLYNAGLDFRGSESLSKRYAFKIETSLNKRQKEKNLFDDFRPF